MRMIWKDLKSLPPRYSTQILRLFLLEFETEIGGAADSQQGKLRGVEISHGDSIKEKDYKHTPKH